MSELDDVHSTKDVSVFKSNKHSGDIGVMDIGNSKATEFVVDLDEIDAMTMLGRNRADNDDLDAILKMGQDGKGFQKAQLGLIDNETGAVDAELIALIKAAALSAEDGGSDSIRLVDAGSASISIAIDGRGSEADVLTLVGDKLNVVLADLSDIPAICDALKGGLDLKNSASQVAVYDFDEKKNHFHGSDADVDSQDVKDILSGSSMQVDEAIELAQYALSAAGQADDGIEIDFNGAGVIVSVDASRDTVDTMVFKGDAFFDGLATTTNASGKSLVDLKNNADQVGVFDFDEANNYFHGSDADVDSQAAKDILGGSSLDAGEAQELIALAESGDDPNVRYLGGDDDSAIIAIDASRDTTDTLFITGDTVFDIA